MTVARGSLYDKLSRVRPPRVHVTYEVEIGDAIELKELPFVMGVLGDFTGQPEDEMPKLMDRKFVEVNPDNFDSVLAGMKPHLAFGVKKYAAERSQCAAAKSGSALQESGRFFSRKSSGAGGAPEEAAGSADEIEQPAGSLRAT